MSDIDNRVRAAYRDGARHRGTDGSEVVWREIARRLTLDPNPLPQSSRPTRRPVRVLLAAIAALMLLGGIAIAAQPELRERFFPAGSTADRMDVMNAPHDTVDVAELPAPHDEMMRNLAQHTGADVDNMRLVLEFERDGIEFRAVALPMPDGAICLVWIGTFGQGGCGPMLRDRSESHSTYAVGIAGLGKVHPFVSGVIDDEVERVRIRMADGSIEPTMQGRNAYLWVQPEIAEIHRRTQLVGAAARGLPTIEVMQPETIVLDMHDGTTQHVAFADWSSIQATG